MNDIPTEIKIITQASSTSESHSVICSVFITELRLLLIELRIASSAGKQSLLKSK